LKHSSLPGSAGDHRAERIVSITSSSVVPRKGNCEHACPDNRIGFIISPFKTQEGSICNFIFILRDGRKAQIPLPLTPSLKGRGLGGGSIKGFFDRLCKRIFFLRQGNLKGANKFSITNKVKGKGFFSKTLFPLVAYDNLYLARQEPSLRAWEKWGSKTNVPLLPLRASLHYLLWSSWRSD